jgi:transcriptional regulator with XRE-family HTH domain
MTTTRTSDDRRQREAALQQQIGANIRAARLERRVLQEELAAALGLERPTLSRYETGERAVPLTVLLDIAVVLRMSLERLISVAADAELPALPLQAAITQQADLTRIIERLSALPEAIPYVDGLLDTLESEHTDGGD